MAEKPSHPSPGSQPQQQPRPGLTCPFCSGKRFDYGRDIYAGPDQVMYCRKTPSPGGHPDKDLSLRMKGAVCLDCGYVVMMVSVDELRAPIRRAAGPAGARAGEAHAAPAGGSPEEEAAKALQEMIRAGETGPKDVAEALEQIRRQKDGFGDLEGLLDDAERRRRPPGGDADRR
ncbi:MAG TPA: hypothetical protein VM031_00955 [Phycisphaerae bacterium]|nr:hypothetical protein [Phycisphaerae bacterium]